MGNTSGGLTATDVSIANHLDPYYWYKTTNDTVKNLAGGAIGPAFNKLLHEYVHNPTPENKDKDIKTAGLSYPEEDEDTYQENAPPAAKKPKGDPGQGSTLGGAGLAGAIAAGAAAAGGHRDPPPPPPPPAREQESNQAGSATNLGQTRTATLTETEPTKEPDMDSEGSGGSTGSHSPMERITKPHIDIKRGENGEIICTINIKRKIVFQSDENPFHRYEIKDIKIHTEFPMVSKKQDSESYKNYTEWNLKLVNSGWKTIDLNSWANWLDYPLYNYMMNQVKRFRVHKYEANITDVYVRDIIQQKDQHVEYDLTEDGRLLVLVDHGRYVPYYSSTGYAPFGRSPHEPFELWDFWYPIFDAEFKSPFYYFEYSPYMETVGPKGTSMSFTFEGGHWKDLRLFRNPIFYRGHRWHLAANKKESPPYKNFNLGPEIGIEGAQFNSTAEKPTRHDHPSIVDYTNNKGDDPTGAHAVTGITGKNTTPIQGPNDYFNFSKDQNENNDFYQVNDADRSFMSGKSKGNWHQGWGQRTQQYIEDTDTTSRSKTSASYKTADEHLVNWKVPNDGFGTHGLTFVMNGPIWHDPHEAIAYPRGLAGCSPIPEAPPQMFVKIKDQFNNTTSYRNQMVNFDFEGSLTLIFETKDHFNPLIFNQLPDEYTTIDGGVDYAFQKSQGTSETYQSPFKYWQDAPESNKVFRGNIYYPQ